MALRRRWSPEQIVGAFRAEGKAVPSHETIYRLLRRDRRCGGTLYRYTRIMSKVGRKRYRSRPTRGVLLGKRHISERAAIVERRGRIGDWEVDTVMGSGSSSCLLTLVERKSGFTLVRKLKARTMAEATNEAAVVIRRMRHKCKRPTKNVLDDRATGGVAGIREIWRGCAAFAGREGDQAAAGAKAAAQPVGVSSSIREAGCVATRSRTSLKYRKGSTPASLQPCARV